MLQLCVNKCGSKLVDSSIHRSLLACATQSSSDTNKSNDRRCSSGMCMHDIV